MRIITLLSGIIFFFSCLKIEKVILPMAIIPEVGSVIEVNLSHIKIQESQPTL
jgi:hypothetical protein